MLQRFLALSGGFPNAGGVVLLQTGFPLIQNCKDMTARWRLQADRELPAGTAKTGRPGEVRSPMSRIIAFLLVLVGTWLPLGAQQKDNLERLRECAAAIADSALAHYAAGDTISLELAPHPASWLLESTLLGAARQRGIGVVSSASPSGGRLVMAITSIGVAYGQTDDDDLLTRECGIGADASFTERGGAGRRMGGSFSAILGDTVEADETSLLEASGYDFTRGALPSTASSGFWKTIVEPAVVLGASVVITILLFTVRSQ